MNDWESKLDARLRQVPLPPGMLARLQGIAAQPSSLSDEELAILSDDALDEQLCAVELPASLVDRVQHEIAAAAVGELIDAQLTNVVVPRGLLKELRQIPWKLTHRRQVQRLAMAAALLLAVSVGYFSVVGAWVASFRPASTDVVAWIELDQRPVTVTGSVGDAITFGADDVAWTPPPPSPFKLAFDDEPAIAQMLVSASDPLPSPDVLNNSGPTRDIHAQFAAGGAWLMRWDILGSPSDVSDRLPPLETLPRLRAAGITRPLVRGFDSGFLFKYGVPPVVSPGAQAELRRVEIPLTTSTESYQLAWQRLREGRFPHADEMHIADFIAAMDYPLPATKPGEVGLRTAAGPSPFGTDGARLLQVCVQAGPLVEAERSPVHLTVALDVSASMNLGGKLETAKRSVRQMLAHLGARDTVSLLLFNDRDQAEIAAVGRAEVPVVLRLLDQVRGSGGTNIAAGIQQGASLAMSDGASGTKRQLVLVTDGRAPLPDATHVALHELLTELKRKGLSWSVLDLSTDESPDPDLARLAKAADGALTHAGSGSEAQWLLTDLLVGRPTIVAPDAALQITFDPRAVAAYRLIGHEPAQLAGLEPAVVSIDLRAGQVASGLLEVWLKPNAHDEVAVAELRWRDPHTGAERRIEQAISRLQFVPTFAEAPLSLQAAAIAAETGEILKESPFAESRNRSLAEVRSLALRVNPRLAEREGYRQFVSFLEAAERLRVRGAAAE